MGRTGRQLADAGFTRVSIGMCSGMMPSSPASPGAITISASPEKISCSAETMSTWMVLAMVVSPY